ncbi:MAG TPA: hypothetical protein VGR84_18665 [Candidatus Acidoferrales bacterium]|nr:hypothetical protein [Candidatus Acidoferrales bacterium]
MAGTSWTPGEWKRGGIFGTVVYVGESYENSQHICDTLGDQEKDAESVANARLIKAAPKLYASLLREYGWFYPTERGHNLDCGCVGCEAFRALAEARGDE